MKETVTEQDPFLFDIDQLNAIAPEPLIRKGLAHYQDSCVTELYCNGELLQANVEE